MTEAQEPTKSPETNRSSGASGAAHRANGAASALDARLSGPLAPLEKSLDDIFGSKASYQLPVGFKDFLVKVAPWLSLASGIFGLLSALSLWRLATSVNEFVDYANELSAAYGGTVQTRDTGVLLWVSLAMIVLFSVLAFLAFPGLRARKKTGWNIMFYSMLASVLYSIVSMFYYGGFGSLLGSLIGTAIGLFLLFQVRSRYTT
jgi:hypothetical protein